jgi:hypothetical protein
LQIFGNAAETLGVSRPPSYENARTVLDGCGEVNTQQRRDDQDAKYVWTARGYDVRAHV